jgi:hypothetical protein
MQRAIIFIVALLVVAASAEGLPRTYTGTLVCQSNDGSVWRIERPAHVSAWPRVVFVPNPALVFTDDTNPIELAPGTSHYYRTLLHGKLPSLVPLGELSGDAGNLTLYASSMPPVQRRSLPSSCYCNLDVLCNSQVTLRPNNAWIQSLARESLPDNGRLRTKALGAGEILQILTTEGGISQTLRYGASLAMLAVALYGLITLFYHGASILPDNSYASYLRYQARVKRRQVVNLDSKTKKEATDNS